MGKDYVDYGFRLTSGEYKPTYRRADGPNPETSTVTTGAYEIGFSDRWFFDALAITAGGASGAEILDGFKFGFAPDDLHAAARRPSTTPRAPSSPTSTAPCARSAPTSAPTAAR